VLLAGLAGCLALSACTSMSDGSRVSAHESLGGIGPSRPAASLSAVHCVHSITWLVLKPDGSTSTHPLGSPLNLHVGDRMMLSGAPGCHLSLSAQDSGVGVLRSIGGAPRGFLAVGPGHGTVQPYHAACDLSDDPECLGGVAVLPSMTVSVTDAA